MLMNTNKQPFNALSTTKFAKYQRDYRNKNKETCIKTETKYRNTTEAKTKAAARYKKWKNLNKQKAAEYQKRYRAENKEIIKQYTKEYRQKRFKNDALFKIQSILRSAVCQAFKRIGKNKPTKTEHLLGCTWEEAKVHFESLFQEGMNWENHGEWHIDHIRPISCFKSSELEQMNHISNLQPLWAKDNLTKGNFYNN